MRNENQVRECELSGREIAFPFSSSWDIGSNQSARMTMSSTIRTSRKIRASRGGAMTAGLIGLGRELGSGDKEQSSRGLAETLMTHRGGYNYGEFLCIRPHQK